LYKFGLAEISDRSAYMLHVKFMDILENFKLTYNLSRTGIPSKQALAPLSPLNQ